MMLRLVEKHQMDYTMVVVVPFDYLKNVVKNIAKDFGFDRTPKMCLPDEVEKVLLQEENAVFVVDEYFFSLMGAKIEFRNKKLALANLLSLGFAKRRTVFVTGFCAKEFK